MMPGLLAQEGIILREPRIVAFIAAMMLLGYVVVALVMYRREKSFLSSVPPARRHWFILQDVLLQISILLVLVPVIIHPDLKGRTPTANTVRLLLVSGFTLLWAAALWMVSTRYWYTRGVLKDIQMKETMRLKELKEEMERAMGEAEQSND